MGMVAAGLETDMTSASERYAVVGSVVEPDPEATARLDELYTIYREAYPALRELFRSLGDPAGA
jgi:sugar (pentulose or hexulose) kinase